MVFFKKNSTVLDRHFWNPGLDPDLDFVLQIQSPKEQVYNPIISSVFNAVHLLWH